MPTVSEVAISQTGICTAVPLAGEGICGLCHGCPNPGFGTCWSCASITSQLSRPCGLVVPISLYDIPSQLHHVLRLYKSPAHQHLHDEFGARVVSLLAHFLAEHGKCIVETAGREWDVITTVPSSGDRTGQHPLVTAIQRVRSLADQHEELLQRGTGTIDHRTATDNGYILTRPLSGERILVVDDTYTSGSRAQSAASALSLGGDVVAIVAIGRVIRPEFSDTAGAYWKRQRRSPFTFDVCCLESDQSDEDEW
jgi:predicted amidophosphoribosyltransferase